MGTNMLRGGMTACLFAVLSGCASTQLNNNTINISSSVDSLYIREALENVSKFVDNPHSIPSQIDISAGTVQTVMTIQPSMTFPLTSQSTRTLTNAAALSRAQANQLSGAGATVGAVDTQQQNWNIIPVNDANALRNLQAIYRYVLYREPLNETYHPPRIYVNNKFYLDPYYLQTPQCVLCARSSALLPPEAAKSLKVNPDLHFGWLHWDDEALKAEAGALVDLGKFGNHELYMSKAAYDNGYLAKFVFFTLPLASEPTETFGGGGGGGGAKGPSNARTSTPRNGNMFPSVKPLQIE
jgi:hypothetical protein